jgi:colanic acid/amylovoran biosynthesis glycosyltransferase
MGSRLNVALLVGPFPKLSKSYIINQITGLKDRGHAVTIISNQDPDESHLHRAVREYDLRDKTVYIPEIPPGPISASAKLLPDMARKAWKKPTLLRGLVSKGPEDDWYEAGKLAYWMLPFFDAEFDIIHCHFGKYGRIAAELKELGIPGTLITTFHGYGIEEGIKKGGEIYEDLFQEAALLLGNSQYTCRQLLGMGAPPSKVKFHPMGINIDQFNCSPPKYSPDRTFTILTVSRLSREKGIDVALSAIATLRENYPDLDFEYRIVGMGDRLDDLKRQAISEGILDLVTFCGSKPRSGVVEELEAADVFILSSRSEGLGVVLLEAQASCLPIVATDVGGIPDAVDRERSAILVPPDDPRSLARALEQVVSQPDRGEGMGRQGRAYVLENFDICSLNDQLVDRYMDALESDGDFQTRSVEQKW